MSESYFFALLPRYLKVQYSFAKTIKPNTKYRIVIYKGIQKCDEMKEGIKSKLIGGKIDLQSPQLFFNIQFYNPTKNIQFTLKLYEEKPNEEQIEIASFTIMSSDYIKTYKNQGQTFYQVDGKFKDDLSIGFDLIVEKSKYSLTDAMKKVAPSTSRSNKQIIDENKSQSSKSKQVIRQGEGFISPKRRLQRKSGHKGKLRSRNSSRQDGQKSPEGSVASSRRKWKKSPPSKQGQHFMHSPKKASPPKVSGTSTGKSAPKSQVSSKSVQRKVQSQSNTEVNQKTYQYKPATNLKYADTKQVFDIQIQRNTITPVKSPVSPKQQNIVEKPQIAKSAIVSPPAKSAGLQSPVSQSSIRQPVSQNNINQPISPKSPIQSATILQPPISPKTIQQQSSSKQVTQTSPPKQSVVSPRNSKSTFVDLEVKHTSQVFDIVQRKNVSSPIQAAQQNVSSSDNYQYQPPKRPSTTLNSPTSKNVEPKVEQKTEIKSNSRVSQKISSPQKIQQKKQKSLQKSNSRSISKVQQKTQSKVQTIDVTFRKTQSVQVTEQKQSDSRVINLPKSSATLQTSQKASAFEQSKVNIKMEGSVHSPKLNLINRDDSKSQKTQKDIEVKAKAIKKQKGFIHESGTLKGSLRLIEAGEIKKHEEQALRLAKQGEQRKHKILYLIFLLVSAFLIYNAMMPTRRV